MSLQPTCTSYSNQIIFLPERRALLQEQLILQVPARMSKQTYATFREADAKVNVCTDRKGSLNSIAFWMNEVNQKNNSCQSYITTF
jgi:hypothetical protein